MSVERILCSAIWYKDVETMLSLPKECDRGVVLCGFTHSSIVYQMIALTKLRTVKTGESSKFGEFVQGFLTTDNRFVNREEAARIAFVSGQIGERKKDLFSEDLW